MKKYNKYRFAKQVRKDDCGPNVIINLMKFSGIKISYRSSYKMLYDFFQVGVYGGTPVGKLNKFLTQSKIRGTKFLFMNKNMPMFYTRKLLRANRSIVLAFHRGTNKTGHVCLIVGSTDRGFQIVNFNSKKTIQTISFASFKRKVLDYNQADFFVFEKRRSKNGKGKKSNERFS